MARLKPRMYVHSDAEEEKIHDIVSLAVYASHFVQAGESFEITAPSDSQVWRSSSNKLAVQNFNVKQRVQEEGLILEGRIGNVLFLRVPENP